MPGTYVKPAVDGKEKENRSVRTRREQELLGSSTSVTTLRVFSPQVLPPSSGIPVAVEHSLFPLMPYSSPILFVVCFTSIGRNTVSALKYSSANLNTAVISGSYLYAIFLVYNVLAPSVCKYFKEPRFIFYAFKSC